MLELLLIGWVSAFVTAAIYVPGDEFWDG